MEKKRSTLTGLLQTIRSLIQAILSILLATIIIVLSPLILLLCGPAGIFRKICFHSAKWFKPSLGKMLTTESTNQALNDLSATVMSCYVVEGRVDVEYIREQFTTKLLNAKFPSTGELMYPELKQNITYWMGFPFWTPLENFRIEDHTSYYKNSTNDKFNMDGPEFKDVLNKYIMRKPWEKDRALWEILIISNVTTKSLLASPDVECSAFIFRYNHCLCDGYSFITFFEKANTFKSKVDEKTVKPKLAISGRRKSKLRMLVEGIILPFKMAYDLASGLLKLRMNDPLKVRDIPPSLQHSSSVSIRTPISEYKQVAAKYDVSFSSVLMATVAKAIRENIVRKFGSVTEDMTLHFPIGLPHPHEKLRNHATHGFITLPLMEPDPVTRLKIIQEELEGVKRSTLPSLMIVINKLVGCQFSWVLKLMLRNAMKQPTFGVSNIPWGNDPVDVFGYPLREGRLVLGAGGTKAVVFAHLSHMGIGQILVSADTAVVSQDEADTLISDSEKELQILMAYESHEFVRTP